MDSDGNNKELKGNLENVENSRQCDIASTSLLVYAVIFIDV